MRYNAKILKDSIAPNGWVRLVTMEITLPRKVLAEFNTHRVFSRNSASSRAIPVKKMLRMVQENPYVPTHWGKNQRGMQAFQEVLPEEAATAEKHWLKARDLAVEQVQKLLDVGIHKQVANRLLEPFMWHTIICTATEWSNFFHLRNHPDADPDIMKPAKMAQEAYENSVPEVVQLGDWHMPLLNIGMDDEEEQIKLAYPDDPDAAMKISVARCARVSYLTHDGVRDFAKDMELYMRLLEGGHMSPTEHVATPVDEDNEEHTRLALMDHRESEVGTPWFGNFQEWVQYRKLIPGEDDMHGHRSEDS